MFVSPDFLSDSHRPTTKVLFFLSYQLCLFCFFFSKTCYQRFFRSSVERRGGRGRRTADPKWPPVTERAKHPVDVSSNQDISRLIRCVVFPRVFPSPPATVRYKNILTNFLERFAFFFLQRENNSKKRKERGLPRISLFGYHQRWYMFTHFALLFSENEVGFSPARGPVWASSCDIRVIISSKSQKIYVSLCCPDTVISLNGRHSSLTTEIITKN